MREGDEAPAQAEKKEIAQEKTAAKGEAIDVEAKEKQPKA